VLAIVLLSVAGLNNKASAQHLVFLFAHASYDVPVDKDFKNNYTYGLGAEGGVGLGTGRTFFTGTIGYTQFEANPGKGVNNLSYVPVKIGFRHYLLIGKVLFINADAGIGTITDRVTHTSQSRFTADIGPGVKLGPFEAILNYDGFTRSDPSGYASWLAFKIGWRIGL